MRRMGRKRKGAILARQVPAAPAHPAARASRGHPGNPPARLLLPLTALLAVLVAAIFFPWGCSGRGQGHPAWLDDPIVPGYSAALVDIGERYSSIARDHGEPEEVRGEGKLHHLFYGRIDPSSQAGPATWTLVIVLKDDGDGVLDGEDAVASLEISGDYRGRTPEDLGLGSGQEEIEARLGPPEASSTSLGEEGEELRLLSYPSRGIDFLVSPSRGTITVIVTPPGGLEPIVEEAQAPAAGDPFGPCSQEPVVPGHSLAGITLGEDLAAVRNRLGEPGNWGSTGEGLLYLAYTQGNGPWRMALYLEDSDGNGKPSAPDRVVSICVREPYSGKTKGGVGIGSPRARVLSEFGRADLEYRSQHLGEETIFMEYHRRGMIFAVNALSGLVVEIDVVRPVTD